MSTRRSQIGRLSVSGLLSLRAACRISALQLASRASRCRHCRWGTSSLRAAPGHYNVIAAAKTVRLARYLSVRSRPRQLCCTRSASACLELFGDPTQPVRQQGHPALLRHRKS